MSGRPFFRLRAGAGCPRRERRTACMKYARAYLPMIAFVLLAALPAMVSAQVVEAGPVDTTAIDQAFDDNVARYHLPGLAVGIVEDGEVVYTRTAGELAAGSGEEDRKSKRVTSSHLFARRE